MEKKLFSPEETAKKFESLPPEIQNLLYSFEMTSIITKIGEKHALHIDQMDRLNGETAQVMLGLTETTEFPAILVEDLNIDQAKADAIARDVNDMLFTKVREAMKKPIVPRITQPTPSSSAASVVSATTTSVPTPTSTPVSAPAVPMVKTVDMHPADVMLTERTIATMPATPAPAAPAATPKPVEQKVEPPKPQDYKADPYREPIS